MKFLSASYLNHDSGISLLENGKLTKTILTERTTRRKHDASIQKEILFDEIQKNNLKKVYISIFDVNKFSFDFYRSNSAEFQLYTEDHHLCHAFSGFYTSFFTDALCIVIDGNGSFLNSGDSKISEIESVYTFKNGKFEDVVFKRYCNENLFGEIRTKINLDNVDFIINENNKITQELGVGLNYERSCSSIGMSFVDGGKLMGLSHYYHHKDKLPQGYDTQEWKDKVDIAYKTQKYTEDQILKFVKKYVDQTGIKNVVLSGGVFLNCASNYNLIKNLDGINIHVDPMCSDNGISIGKSLLSYYQETERVPRRVENSYLGLSQKSYPFETCGFEYKKNVSYKDIIDIILDGNIVGLFQGQSEVGQRALGNRSLLFDPRIKDGKTIVNRIKKRENYRPFAASALLEYANDWFDMRSLKESPHMSFAVDAKENAIQQVPSVIHVNNTCRVQTVAKKQNRHFYNLIKEFYNKTRVPMLLNTSFNLAGEPLVEIFSDALHVMNNSELKYVYFPEVKTLIFK